MLRISLKKAALLLTGVALLAASVAQAENAASGRVVVNVEGGIKPSFSAPSNRFVPVGMLLGASVTTADHSVPPELKQVIIQFNHDVSLQTVGLPSCSLARLGSVSAETAKRECAAAMVGHGNVSARIHLPEQVPFESQGKLLAFNGHIGLRPAIFAQVTGSRPLPFVYVIPFEIKRIRGTLATEMIGTVPPFALGYGGYGGIIGIHLSFKRFYSHAGRTTSLLRAKCPKVPPFADSLSVGRTSFYFSDGTQASSMFPQCRIRR